MGRRDRDEREEIEREAAEELRRVAQRAGVPPPDRLDQGSASSGPARRYGTPSPPPPAQPRSSGYKPQAHLRGAGSAEPPSPPAPPATPPPPRRSWGAQTQRPPEPPPEPPPPAYDRQSWTPLSETGPLPKLSVEEEEEILIEMALHDWATQSGRTANPEDLVIPRLDPASLEAQRDRALQAEIERQRKFQQYRQRNTTGQVAQPQRHGAGAPTLWVQAPTAQPFVPGLAPDLDRIASQHSGPARTAPAEPEAPARKAPARKTPGRRAPAPAAQSPIEAPAPVTKVAGRTPGGRKAAAAPEAPVAATPIEVPPAPAKKAGGRGRKAAAAAEAPVAAAPIELPAAPAKKAGGRKATAKKAAGAAEAPAKKAPAASRSRRRA